MNRVTKLLAANLFPGTDFVATQELVRKDRRVDLLTKAMWNAIPYSQYAYGIHHAAGLAKRLGIEAISVVEFGVAGGNGLVAMENYADQVSKISGVEIQVFGFDTGEGLTPPRDYRDMPYRFAAGNYKMDVPKLRARLKPSTTLVMGDVAETARSFLRTFTPAPVGFVSFDMDYYSSTMDAFAMFMEDQEDRFFLPRIQCYFDDIIGSETSSYNDFVGELAAIRDFNLSSESVKIAESRVFRAHPINFGWYHQIYVMHRFQHRRYGAYVSKASPGSMQLK